MDEQGDSTRQTTWRPFLSEPATLLHVVNGSRDAAATLAPGYGEEGGSVGPLAINAPDAVDEAHWYVKPVASLPGHTPATSGGPGLPHAPLYVCSGFNRKHGTGDDRTTAPPGAYPLPVASAPGGGDPGSSDGESKASTGPCACSLGNPSAANVASTTDPGLGATKSPAGHWTDPVPAVNWSVGPISPGGVQVLRNTRPRGNVGVPQVIQGTEVSGFIAQVGNASALAQTLTWWGTSLAGQGLVADGYYIINGQVIPFGVRPKAPRKSNVTVPGTNHEPSSPEEQRERARIAAEDAERAKNPECFDRRGEGNDGSYHPATVRAQNRAVEHHKAAGRHGATAHLYDPPPPQPQPQTAGGAGGKRGGKGTSDKPIVGPPANPGNEKGAAFEEWLAETLGAKTDQSSRKVKGYGITFDGRIDKVPFTTVWYEAKNMDLSGLEECSQVWHNLKSKWGVYQTAAYENGGVWQVHTANPLPDFMLKWLKDRGVEVFVHSDYDGPR